MVKDPKEVVRELVRAVGKPGARSYLIKAGVKKDTAHKLVGEKYGSSVGFELHLKISKAKELLIEALHGLTG